MFKAGEIAGVKRQKDRRVKIVGIGPAGSVSTSEGLFEESELFVAHPTVLATATGLDRAKDALDDHIQKIIEAAKTGLPIELRKELERAIKALTVDWNGHWKSGKAIRKEYRDEILKNVFLGHNAMAKEDAEAFLDAVRTKTPLTCWVPVDFHISLRTCSFCGEENFGLETNGEKIRFGGPRCPFAKGMPLTEWELNVPSGQLVVANDLRGLFPIDEEFDINMAFGCRQTALAYAAVGLAHAFVSNTSPGVYWTKGGKFKIASPPSPEKWNGKEWVPIKTKFEGKQVAGICTDLWWYSLCDHDEFLRRCERFKRKPEDFGIEVVKVPSGVYRFRHNEEAPRNEEPGECVFARFERVRKADPVKDFLAPYEEVEVHAHAYVQASVERWPTLYGKVKDRLGKKEEVVPWADMTEEDRNSSWQRVADHVMCVIGGGIKWHEKGFPQEKVDASVPDMEPPSFRAQHHWYPFSEPYGGLFEPKVLAPSFAKLAFRVLESVISFGTDVPDDDRCRGVVYVRERMLVAVKRYRQLAKQYPDLADPEYVLWLGQKGRAEAWVKNFALGPEFTEKHKKHAKKQRWIPEDAYAVEFDASKLKEGHFAWHPKVMGCWANKKYAQRYALLQWEDNEQAPERNCFWTCNAASTTVPLYTVARVVKVGAVSHMGETLVEMVFDYGTPWMQDSTKRKALSEAKEKAGLRVLTKEEYEKLLPGAIMFFENAEASVVTKRSE